MPLPDLITTDRALAALDNPSAGDVAQVATYVTAASRAVRSITKQAWSIATYDEIYGMRTFGKLVLRHVPVVGPVTVRTHPTPVLTVTNDNADYQQAWAYLATTGDAVAGFASTGITLNAVASGVPVAPVALTFAANPTLTAMAQAIAAAGNGWSATVASGYESWPSADLRAPQGNLYCMTAGGTTFTPASFFMHVHFENGFTMSPDDLEAGIVNFNVSWSRDIQWAFYFPEATADVLVESMPYQIGIDAYRVIYQAGYWCETQASASGYPGYPTLPEDLADAVAIIVRTNLGKRKVNPIFLNRNIGEVNYTYSQTASGLYIPPDAREVLFRYQEAFSHLDT